MRWLPWRFLLRRAARAHGFLDPIALINRLQSLTQPAEVAVPTELLRAGVAMHARGLINSRVIQHNLDWVWPYWVERQFDPSSESFVPRAFSITHINLTHRDWTAVGLPDLDALPVVDPRGLVTPNHDGWSLDAWVVTDDGRRLLPSRAIEAFQRLDLADGPAVVTTTGQGALRLSSRVDAVPDGGHALCRIALEAEADGEGWLVVALRPYNPEGISLVHKVALAGNRRGWRIEDAPAVDFDTPVEGHHVSTYFDGDALIHLGHGEESVEARCDVGLATAAALFRLEGGRRRVTVTVPLAGGAADDATRLPGTWSDALDGAARLSVPDARMRALYDAAIQTLVLHTPGDVYPGPFTYKRFWFRDAAFILNALLAVGFDARAERVLDRFPERQTVAGYFKSQDGEWDSNGAALWILERFAALTGRPVKPEWRDPIVKGARWITRKRTGAGTERHPGLLPAGFSAEHLGPNDFYYWDDFFGIAGLESAARLARSFGATTEAERFEADARTFRADVDRSLAGAAARIGRPALPAAPDRRLDSGAIGSIAAGYPLDLLDPADPRLLDLAAYLHDSCFVDGAFFQDMIHSGVNAYLTLHVAQVFQAAGDPRHFELTRRVAELASPTGQWPEAINPRSHGGCMGDGQHVWAAAEWVMIMRNSFVRETKDGLTLGGGLAPDWLTGPQPLSFGPTPTPWGPVTVTITPEPERIVVEWEAAWRETAPPVTIRMPTTAPVTVDGAEGRAVIARGAAS
ncbi:MAG: hypothetical protein RID91_20105 [Azospirillaceae bacterium]